jgi:hypothetical protein
MESVYGIDNARSNGLTDPIDPAVAGEHHCGGE